MPTYDDGHVRIGDQPGLGIDANEEADRKCLSHTLPY